MYDCVNVYVRVEFYEDEAGMGEIHGESHAEKRRNQRQNKEPEVKMLIEDM